MRRRRNVWTTRVLDDRSLISSSYLWSIHSNLITGLYTECRAHFASRMTGITETWLQKGQSYIFRWCFCCRQSQLLKLPIIRGHCMHYHRKLWKCFIEANRRSRQHNYVTLQRMVSRLTIIKIEHCKPLLWLTSW